MIGLSEESGADGFNFSILTVFNELSEGSYKIECCEHFNTIAVGKFESVCKVAVPTEGTDGHRWLEFDFEENSIIYE